MGSQERPSRSGITVPEAALRVAGRGARGRLTRRGEVAQLVEHATENRGVGSSILPLAIISRGSVRARWPADQQGNQPSSNLCATALSDARVVAEGDVSCVAPGDHELERRRGTHQTVHRLSHETVRPYRYHRLACGSVRVRRERHVACPIQAQPGALHRTWGTSWVTGPLDRTRRSSGDRDDQRPGAFSAARLATTVRDQQQQPDHKQASHSSLTATAKRWFPRAALRGDPIPLRKRPNVLGTAARRAAVPLLLRVTGRRRRRCPGRVRRRAGRCPGRTFRWTDPGCGTASRPLRQGRRLPTRGGRSRRLCCASLSMC